MEKSRADKTLGLTLIELLLVISIIMILGTFSSVFYSNLLSRNAVSNTAEQLVGQLRKAQIYTMEGKGNDSWGVRIEPSQIVLFAGSTSAFDEVFSVNQNISVTGFTQVLFSKPSGIPDSTPTITVSGNNNTETITVNSEGMINK